MTKVTVAKGDGIGPEIMEATSEIILAVGAAIEIEEIESRTIKLTMITNRGIKVWPDAFEETFCTDHWKCRFKPNEDAEIDKTNIIELLLNAINENIDTIKTENLYSFDGKADYSLGQSQ